MQRLRQEGLRAKAKKCHFAMAQCSYLGHVVGQGRVAPEACKVEAVQAFAQPKTKKGHLSLCWPRRLLQEIHSCICRADTVGLTYQWTPELQTAFKEELNRGPTLDFGSQFYLQTDASERGIGAVLTLWERSTRLHTSRENCSHVRYTATEKECLGIVAALKHFAPYLLGRRLTVQTDHQAWLLGLQWSWALAIL